MFLFATVIDLFGLLVLILHILAVASILLGEGSAAHKSTWTLVVILLPVLGLVLYLAVGRSRKDTSLAEL